MAALFGAALALAVAAAPAQALLAPNPYPVWRVGYAWTLGRPAHGLDWGVGVRLPVQTSELGIISLNGTVEATWPGPGDWMVKLGGLVTSYRGRPSYGVFYSLARFAGPTPSGDAAGSEVGPLTGLAIRVAGLGLSYYPGSWNLNHLKPDETVAVLEPGYFSGLFLQLRLTWLKEETTVRVAFGLEENW